MSAKVTDSAGVGVGSGAGVGVGVGAGSRAGAGSGAGATAGLAQAPRIKTVARTVISMIIILPVFVTSLGYFIYKNIKLTL